MDSTWLTLGILLVGVVTVVGGVLLLRLHAFLALVLGALFVGLLAPTAAVERHELEKRAIKFRANERIVLEGSFRPGTILLVLRQDPASGAFEEVSELRVEGPTERADESIATLVSDDPVSRLSLQPGDVVIRPVEREDAMKATAQTVGERLAGDFGRTCAKIGILIAMASIIGKCLLDSGAADRIVRTALQWLGERRAGLAFMSSGFLLGIPVFFDTVFYLMIPLGKAMRMRTGRNYLLYVLAIVSGGSMAHSLVPPTPGPLFVAEELGVDIGTMIVAGGIVGAFTSAFGLFYATRANRRWELPLRDSPGFSLADLEELSRRDEKELPSFRLSVLPIVLPVVLIAGYTVLKPFSADLPGGLTHVLATLGNKNIALVVAAAIAIILLVRSKRTSKVELASSVQSALGSGGTIILITAGGGAFGGMLQQTGVAGLVRDLPETSAVVIVLMAFLITAAIRTAQGSATVAMITAVGVLSGLVENLGFHPVYLALAIGCAGTQVSDDIRQMGPGFPQTQDDEHDHGTHHLMAEDRRVGRVAENVEAF